MKKLYMVSYFHRMDKVRAMLKAEKETEIKPMLLRYHMETRNEVIQVKRIREYDESQNFLHIWYSD